MVLGSLAYECNGELWVQPRNPRLNFSPRRCTVISAPITSTQTIRVVNTSSKCSEGIVTVHRAVSS
jgi:hypothetical protein